MASGDVRHLMDMILNSNNQLPLPFAQTPILVSGQNMMARWFYVDAENGDDNNDGSSSAPFKTIKKACNSVPNGGYGWIRLASGQTFLIDSDIWLECKRIVFESEDIDNKSIMQNTAYLNDDNKVETHGFYILNSQLAFYGKIKIKTANYPTNAQELEMLEGFIKRYDFVFGTVQFRWNIEIELGDTDLIRLPNGPSTLFVDFHSGSINRTGTNRDAYVIYNEAGNFGLSVCETDIGSLSWSDLVSGIVKDANGVPRNIISNVVF